MSEVNPLFFSMSFNSYKVCNLRSFSSWLCRVCVLLAMDFSIVSHNVPLLSFRRLLNIFIKNATASITFVNHRRWSRRLGVRVVQPPPAQSQCVGHDGVVARAAVPNGRQRDHDGASILQREVC